MNQYESVLGLRATEGLSRQLGHGSKAGGNCHRFTVCRSITIGKVPALDARGPGFEFRSCRMHFTPLRQ